MKFKIISFLATAILCSLTVAAQPSLGIKGGLNLAHLNHDYVELTSQNITNEVNPGWTFGLFADFPLIGNFSIQPELNYIEKGATFKDESVFDAHYKMTWRYLEMPLLAKYKFGKVYFSAGPAVGYAFDGNQDFKSWKLPGSEPWASRTTGNFDYEFRGDSDKINQSDNQWDLGLMLGIGTELPLGSGQFILDARYGWDLTDNINYNTTIPKNYSGTHHRDLAITIGYSIPVFR